MPSIDIDLNARAAERNLQALGAAFEDVSDNLDDLGRSRAGAQLEDSLQDVERQAKRTDDSIDRIGNTGSAGLGKVRAAAQEATQEVGQNLGEAVSSVRDNMGDLAQVGQDTLGGLSASLTGAGPAGLVGAAALAAGAVGLGLVTASLQEQQAEADALKARLTDAYQSAAEKGRDYLDVAEVIGNANDLMFNADRAGEWQKVQETQKETGLSLSTILKANAGDLDAVAIVMGRVKKANEDAAAAGEEANLFTDIGGTKLQQLANFWNDAGNAAESSSQKARDSIEFTNQYLREQIDAAQGATKEVDALGNELYTLPDGEKILIEADTGKATDDVSRFKGVADAAAEPVTKKVSVVLDDSAIRNYRPPIIQIQGQLSVPRGSVVLQ